MTENKNPVGSPKSPHQHGTSTITKIEEKKGLPFWVWLLPLLLLAGGILLYVLTRDSHDAARPEATSSAVASGSATPAVGVKQFTLPGGQVVALEPGTLNFLLQDFLASSALPPRRFVFERLNFASASAELPGDAKETVQSLALILKAYPKAQVRVDGYADSSGDAPSNMELGAKRAQSVVKMLVDQGVEQGRITAATGGEQNPIDTNATPKGRAENRRTELVVTAK